MKLGIAGTGGMVRDLMNVLPMLDLEEIWLFGRPESEEKTRQMARSMTGCVFAYEDLLQKDIDTVYIALPNDLHYTFARDALLAGKHVILEKPSVSTPDELEDLIRLCRSEDLMMTEAMNIYSLPAFQALKEQLPQIGKLKMAVFNYTQYSSRYDRLKAGEAAPVFQREKSGGALMDLNVYNIHALTGLLGIPERIRYGANMVNGVDTSGIALLEYSGIQAAAIGAKDCVSCCVSTLEGEEGYIRIDQPVNHMTRFSLHRRNGESTQYDFEEGRHRLYYEFREFIERFQSHDTRWRDERLKQSLDCIRLLAMARKDAGILFPADEK